jgi:FHS family L-fucose permease-like MFS transporter
MFSNVFTLAIDGLGKYTSQGSSLLVMMILGGAVLPPLQGMVADYFGVQMAFFIPMICYAYLVWYGFIGCNIRKDKSC